jgi:putative transposase
MAESVASMVVRMLVATWPEGMPRGAVTRFCEEYGVSRAWFYKVRALARDNGAVQATQRTRPVPRVSPTKIPAEVEELAVRVRKELADGGWDYGPISVHDRMVKLNMPAPSRATLARIFDAHGMVVPQPQKRPRSSFQRFTYADPNGCWQLDGTEVDLAGDAVAVALQVEDDHSRKILGSLACESENAKDAWKVTERAILKHGIPQRFLTDNGLALNPSRRGYLGLLTGNLQALGVQTIASSPYKPTTCGKNERLHSTLKRWLAARPAPVDLAALQVLLEQFELLYNTERGHQSLVGRCTPQQAWDATPKAAVPALPGQLPRHPSRTALSLAAARQLTAGPGTAVHSATVNPKGRLATHGLTIQLGSRHAGQPLLAVREADQLRVFQPLTGELVRTLTLIKDQQHYGPEPVTGPRVQHAKVGEHGQVAAFKVVIHIGSEHIGRTLLAVLDNQQIQILNPNDGAVLRELTVEPNRRYYGSGRPRGKRLPRLAAGGTS